jgi:quercetin dioxygenase-like cupin family protein
MDMIRHFKWIGMVAALLASSVGTAHGASDGSTVSTTFSGQIPNIPGKSLTTVTVSYAPGGSSTGHRHPATAYIWAYVIEGAILSQVEGEPAHVYRAGESFTENPGAHHMRSENASKTKPAKLLAVFVVNTSEKELVTPDHD